MCGRFYFDYDIIKTNIDDFNLDENDFKKGEVFPTNKIVVKEKGGYEVLRWGIKPAWSKSLIINARIETIKEKNFFKNDFVNHRCVIIATSYFEWTNKSKKEIKTDNSILYFAGIYKIIDDNKEVVIITKNAQDEIKNIHDRMPVILNEDEVSDYLNDNDVLFKKTSYHNFIVTNA